MATAVTWRFASNNVSTLAADDLVDFIFSIVFRLCYDVLGF